MPIIIDGWNLLRSDSSRIDDDGVMSIESALELIAYLEDFQRLRGDPIVLVFDSTKEYLGIDRQNTAKLTVIAARNADNYIRRYIDNVPERQRRNLRVISSDNGVYYYAKSAYAEPIRSEEFWKKLDKR
ncbi:MAG: NYN domain-containing protein [Candidatus Omnitrophica bacterium]|nr:NYN domain-containing protein [Candidatus Omnitrophota bacterium]